MQGVSVVELYGAQTVAQADRIVKSWQPSRKSAEAFRRRVLREKDADRVFIRP